MYATKETRIGDIVEVTFWEAIATLPTTGGQKQVALKVVPSEDDKGWDIVADDGERTARATN